MFLWFTSWQHGASCQFCIPETYSSNDLSLMIFCSRKRFLGLFLILESSKSKQSCWHIFSRIYFYSFEIINSYPWEQLNFRGKKIIHAQHWLWNHYWFSFLLIEKKIKVSFRRNTIRPETPQPDAVSVWSFIATRRQKWVLPGQCGSVVEVMIRFPVRAPVQVVGSNPTARGSQS